MSNKEIHPDYLWLNGLDEYFHSTHHPDAARFKDIKNSILYGNPYSIRNLIMNEIHRGMTDNSAEFTKALLSYYLDNEPGNDRRVLQYISYCIDDEFVRTASSWSIKWHQLVNLNDHLSRGQVSSKLWMVTHLNRILKKRREDGFAVENIVQYGGWYATVAWFILQQNPDIKQYFNIEADPSCIDVADDFNQKFYNDSWRFKSVHQDVDKIHWEDRTFSTSTLNRQNQTIDLRLGPNLIINTSCEHMTDDWFYNLPSDMIVCLQTNNYFSREEHINCVKNLDEAIEKYQFKRVYYSGELETHLYNRYMIIGRT